MMDSMMGRSLLLEQIENIKNRLSDKIDHLEERKDFYKKLAKVKGKCQDELKRNNRVAFAEKETLATIRYFEEDGRAVINIDEDGEKLVDPCKLRTITLDEENNPEEYNLRKNRNGT